MSVDDFGFLMTRHVNNERTNRYWNQNVKLLRTLYPLKQIIIIDDNSDVAYLSADCEYKNVRVIQSEFPGRGELLPYYYYLREHFFDYAVILHDSVFFHQRFPFEYLIQLQTKVMPLWHFVADKENLTNTQRIAHQLKQGHSLSSTLAMSDMTVLGMKKDQWNGCFGVQCFIQRDFLCMLERKYQLTALVNAVHNRADRCCLERILGCIFSLNSKLPQASLLGNIMQYQVWDGYSFEEYESDFAVGKITKPVLKVWTGR